MAAPELSPAELAPYSAVVLAEANAQERVRLSLVEFIRRVLAGLFADGSVYSDAEVRRVAAQIGEQVRTGQVAVADVTTTYLDRALDMLEADARRSDRAVLPDPMRGVDPAEQWERPAEEYRRGRLQGLDDFEAAERALRRADTMVEDDLNLAHREASRQRLSVVPDVLGWRRVLRPELSVGGSCGLCIAASTRLYSRGELMPIHARCKCKPFPVVRGKADPGQQLNGQDLDALYQQALEASGGDNSAAALKRVRFQVHDHGELGPVLRAEGDRFRGPKKAAKAATAQRTSYDGEIAALERTSADLQRRQDAGEDVSGPLAYQRERLATLRRLRDAA